jgi:hypothetical protein
VGWINIAAGGFQKDIFCMAQQMTLTKVGSLRLQLVEVMRSSFSSH